MLLVLRLVSLVQGWGLLPLELALVLGVKPLQGVLERNGLVAAAVLRLLPVVAVVAEHTKR